MSRNRTRLGFLLAALLLLFISVKPAVAQDDYGGDIDYQQFYDELSPYGQWVEDPDYGYVWIPEAGDDFRPYYSNGYWAHTDYGNTWVSNYNWGWAPFHYGRWTYNNFYGWMWIPGNTWGPAWVSWRGGGANYGWAPLGPGISLNIAIGGYSCPDYWWNFMPQQHIFNRNWSRYSYGPRYNNTYINQTTIINNTYIVNRNTYLGGPRREDLRRATGREVRSLAINNSNGPQRARVRGNNLNIYRPQVAATRGTATMRPREVRQAERPIRGNTPGSAAGFGTRPDMRAAPAERNSRNNRPGAAEIRSNPALRGEDRSMNQPQPGNDRRVLDRNRDQSPARVTPDRDNWNTPQQQQPVQPQANPRRFDDARPHQPRSFEQRPQRLDPAPQPQPRSFEQPRRQPRFEQAPQPQQQRSFDRPQRSFDRPQPAQQPRFEQPRQQPQPQPQRSFDQPRPQPQRSFDQPRPQPQRSFEQPRAMPQQSPSVSPREGRFGR